jgi:hypothetical protein
VLQGEPEVLDHAGHLEKQRSPVVGCPHCRFRFELGHAVLACRLERSLEDFR